MKKYIENPPTAGLPLNWGDWFAHNQDLSERIGTIFNLPPVSVTCSGTIALVTALTVLRQHHSHRVQVIIPAYTCPLVALAIHHCGLKVILCDVATDSFEFDLNQLQSLLNEQVLAVIPTHLGGRVANISNIKRLTEPYQIAIIEDAAQALGADVGQDGDIVFFSLAVGKGLTLYEGGLLSASDPDLNQQLTKATKRIPRHFGWEVRRIIALLGYTALYHPFGLYFVYGQPRRRLLAQGKWIEAVGDDFTYELPFHRVSQFRQRVAANAISRLPSFLAATAQQALKRVQQLQMIPGIHVITDQSARRGTWPFIMVLLPSKSICDNILRQLWSSSLGVSRLFIYALSQYSYLNSIIPPISMPHAEDFAQRMLTITNSLWLDDKAFEQIYITIQSSVSLR
ncbi:dTDP-4-amino-4,6-dideoxygalactose transaminase [Orbus hercynius]|uniref:dTDP-4-amino-4,6-dideoxygalactose transaminase n=1 Tax=Orbus hercynius TaxID=593135 RepID=A0A495RC00_9GAMM|nr:DegT/DnrJ/EryC1/StrS family aminotransferase [Orbus hercynius]RKS84796.1 dTDP-4-amino-4,6-dideoxygalactose transaminase [Orbus hercynius]